MGLIHYFCSKIYLVGLIEIASAIPMSPNKIYVYLSAKLTGVCNESQQCLSDCNESLQYIIKYIGAKIIEITSIIWTYIGAKITKVI